MAALTLTDLAWLAGLLEGEGCFRSKDIRIQLSMCDKDVVHRAAEILKAPSVRVIIPRQAHYKIQYSFAINGYHAASWMMTLWNFMGVRKRNEIKLSVKRWLPKPVYIRSEGSCCRGHAYTAENTRMKPRYDRKPGFFYRSCRECERARFKRAYDTKRKKVCL